MIAGMRNDTDCLMMWAVDQLWDEETIKQLKEEYYIFFRSAGVRPVMLIPYNNQEGCCVVIGSEDDGCIIFNKDKYGNFINAMSPYWINDLITDLTDAKEYVENGGKV